MKKKILNYRYNCIITIILIITIDFITKQWVYKNINLYDIKYIFYFLNFYHTHNYGIIFGWCSNNAIKNSLILTTHIIAILTILIYTIYNNFLTKLKHTSIAYTLILSGAIGNCIDRIHYGFIIDFIDIHYTNKHFFTFNIADISIFLGFLLLLFKVKIVK